MTFCLRQVFPFSLRTCALATIGLLLLVNGVAAQDGEWKPPEPTAGSLDWILLTSGEWLHGELKSIRDGNVEFDSEELDLLKLDFEDIAEIRSPRILTYGFEGRITATGTATMKDGVLRIRRGENIREFSRADLLSVIEGDLSEWNLWSLKASVGMVGRSGNTDQADATVATRLRRQSTRTRLDLEYHGNFGEVNGERTINNHQADATFDILVSKGFFVTPVALSLYSDRLQNINIRYTLGAGAGYFVIRRSDLEWKVNLAGGYQSTQFVSVEADKDEEENSATVIPGTLLEWDITGDVDLDINYKARIDVPEVRNTLHNFSAVFAIEIYGSLDFDIALTWDRIENPTANAEGIVPERDDLSFSFGFGVDI